MLGMKNIDLEFSASGITKSRVLKRREIQRKDFALHINLNNTQENQKTTKQTERIEERAKVILGKEYQEKNF